MLVQHVRDYALILLDPEGRVASWNAGAERLLGYREAEILGRDFSCFFTPEERQEGLPQRELKTAANTGIFQDENWSVRKDGSRFWASGINTALPNEAGQPLPDNPSGVRGFVKIFRDLTERRQAEEDLRQSEERLRVALAAARMGTWIWYFQEDKHAMDESLQRLMGVPKNGSMGNLENFLSLIHPEDRAEVAAAFALSAREGALLNVEFRVPQPDGTVRWIQDQGDVARDPQTNSLYLAGACMDITDRKRMEGELQQAHDDLEQQVEQRTAELVQAQQNALQAERLAAIGQTVAGLAHEGRNALQRSQNYLERLRWRLQDRPEALELLAEIQKAQDDLLRLYDDVRGYASPINLECQRCNLASVWREAWADLTDLWQNREARLEEEISGVDLVCEADPFRLKQVFRNIFENSLAATPGAVVVTISCAEDFVQEKSGVRLSIRDNGPGLNEEQRQKLFEPFYTTKAKGTGLGMAIAQRIISAHQGSISVGKPALGAEIMILLPRSRV